MTGDLLPRDRVDRLGRAQDGAAERRVAEQLGRERLVDGVGGIVVVHGDLFQDHPPLGVDVLRLDERVGHHVG
jgi:hypothetical protein